MSSSLFFENNSENFGAAILLIEKRMILEIIEILNRGLDGQENLFHQMFADQTVITTLNNFHHSMGSLGSLGSFCTLSNKSAQFKL